MLAHEFPPWGTVHYYYRQWRRDGTWEAIQTPCGPRSGTAGQHKNPSRHHRQPNREDDQMEDAPATTGQANQGMKRHILVDTLGLLLASWSAPQASGPCRREAHVGQDPGPVPAVAADLDRSGIQPVASAKSLGGWTLESLRKPKELQNLQVLPHQWKVGRTLGG